MTWTGLKAIDSFGFISFINIGLRFFQLLRIGFFKETTYSTGYNSGLKGLQYIVYHFANIVLNRMKL